VRLDRGALALRSGGRLGWWMLAGRRPSRPRSRTRRMCPSAPTGSIRSAGGPTPPPVRWRQAFGASSPSRDPRAEHPLGSSRSSWWWRSIGRC